MSTGAKRLRVLHFPDWRAGNPYQELLAKGLDDQGVDVVFPRYVGALFPLLRGVRTFSPDVLHIHWVGDIFGANESNPLKYLLKQVIFRLDVLLASRRLRGRLVWTVHNLRAHECRHPEGDLRARSFLARRTRLVAHCGAARLAVAGTYGVPEGAVEVIFHGNYLDSYPQGATRGDGRQKLQVPDDRLLYLCLGSLRPYKGIEMLMESFMRVSIARKRLLVAGASSDAEYDESLRRRAASPEISFCPGFISGGDLQYYLAAADIVVLPFRDVLTSGSVLLAMGFGRLVVAPRLGCIPDYLDDVGAVLYDPEVPGALDEALVAASSRDLIAAGRRNQERARGFDWHVTASKTADIYRGLMGSMGRAS